MAENKGVLPSSNVNTLGNANNKWENVYANKFTGAVAGNAATATKATQDSAGQQINSTYIKGLSASNATLTYTKGNGTTSTVTVNNVTNATNATNATQDSAGQQINATYIKGLSISGNTITYTKGNGSTGTITVPTGGENKSYITESKYNEDGSWYRKYSDGWLEQGGFCNATSNGEIITVNLLKPMKNTNYIVLKNFNTTMNRQVEGYHGGYVQAFAKTATSFKTYDGLSIFKTVWYACGQSA